MKVRSIVCCLVAVALSSLSAAPGELAITALSTDPARVTGGDVLVRVSGVPTAAADDGQRGYSVVAAGKDVTAAFRADEDRALVGLVTGLPLGKSAITVQTTGGDPSTVSLDVTNYPISGPVLSGPWVQPFICQTHAFELPDGSKLGPPLDANCSAKTVVQHIYRTTGEKPVFKPLARLPIPLADTDPNARADLKVGAYALPSDLAQTTNTRGATVNFIVRVETGTMNRAIYQNLVLHDPAVDPEPTPFAPPRGWNRRFAALHGVGCAGGWYTQGAAMGVSPLDAARLGQGYAIFISTLNHPNNSCNPIVAGETTMMGKERLIEMLGVPEFTISSGTSGGAYTSLQVADAFPGLLDGVDIRGTFPDALSIALAGLDGRLLMRYFTTTPHDLTEAQKVAISGYQSMKAFLDAANQAQRTDPISGRKDIEGYQAARWNGAVPAPMRYDPAKNPNGARPTVFDWSRNIYGIDASTGAALRPFDNVGVQYGLNALNAGLITPAQFLDLNEKIGGFDSDANPIAQRTAGDAGAIARAYQSGILLGGGGGLASIPIVNNGSSNEASGYHYGWFHYAVRERLRHANGSAENMLIWRSTTPAQATAVFDEWMEAIARDTSQDPRRLKVIRARPAWAKDGCYDGSTPPKLLTEELVFSAKPVSACTELYPVYSNVRVEAGGPLAANVLKCQRQPPDPTHYTVAMTTAEVQRLKQIFPDGVCDFSKPGVNQTGVVPWSRWGG